MNSHPPVGQLEQILTGLVANNAVFPESAEAKIDIAEAASSIRQLFLELMHSSTIERRVDPLTLETIDLINKSELSQKVAEL